MESDVTSFDPKRKWNCPHTYLDRLPNETLEHIAEYNPTRTVTMDKKGRAVFSMGGIVYGRLNLFSLRDGKVIDCDRDHAVCRSTSEDIATFIEQIGTKTGPTSSLTLMGTAVRIVYEKGKKKEDPSVFRFSVAHGAFYINADDFGKEQVKILLEEYIKFKQRAPQHIRRGQAVVACKLESFDWDAWIDAHSRHDN